MRRTDATRRAQRVRDGVTAINEVIETLVEIQEQQDWMSLGYKSWLEYYEGEFGDDKLKLTPEQRGQVISVLVHCGVSRRQLAKAFGISEGTVRNSLKGKGVRNDYALPAGNVQVNNETAVDEPNTSADDGSTLGSSMAPTPSASGPSASPSVDGPDVTPETAAGGLSVAPPVDGADESRQSLGVPAGDGPNAIRPVPGNPNDSSPEASEASPQGEAPADGTVNPSPEQGPAVATPVEPGIEPPLAGGEAPAHASVPAAGGTPLVGDGDGVDRDEVEGEAEHSPSTDPASTFMDDWRRFVRLIAGVDTEVVGPMLTEAEFTELYGDLELLREQLKKLQRHA